MKATTWADEIILTTAEVLATYDQGWLAGYPAITLNEYGKGKLVYVGTELQGETLGAFVSWLCKQAGVTAATKTPEGVRAYERQSDSIRLLFLLNFSAAEQTVVLDGRWEDALTGERCAQVKLQAADVRVLRKAKH